MKIIINYTLFGGAAVGTPLAETQIREYFNVVIKYQMDTLGYILQKACWGYHVIASRPHYHVLVLVDTADQKTYKCLTPKLRSLTKNIPPCTNYSVKYSLTDSTQSIFDEDCLAYGQKEYQSHNWAQSYGILEADLKAMQRRSATIWNKTVKEKNRKDKEKRQQTELISFITLGITMDDQGMNPSDDIQKKIDLVKRLVLRWKKNQYHLGNCKYVNVSQLRNQAISFLYFHDYASEEQILDL